MSTVEANSAYSPPDNEENIKYPFWKRFLPHILIVIITLLVGGGFFWYISVYSARSKAANEWYYGTLLAATKNRCGNTDNLICYKLIDPVTNQKTLLSIDTNVIKESRISNLAVSQAKVKVQGIPNLKYKDITYMLINKIERDNGPITPVPVASVTLTQNNVKKVVEFSNQTWLTTTNPWTVYNDLKINYVIGRLGYSGDQPHVEYVSRFGLKKYIPLTTSYPPSISRLTLLQNADTGNSPEYAICFNEENEGYHPAWTASETEDKLVKCIKGFKDIWPNIKIIVNLGAQVYNSSTGPTPRPTTGYFPDWPESVWPAFANHIDDIYGFGLHLYPQYTCKTSYEGKSDWPWHSPPSGHDTKTPDSLIECTRRYIYAAKYLMQSHSVNKALVFTEFNVGSGNTNSELSAWKDSSTWERLWQTFKAEKIEFVSVFATTYLPDGTLSFDTRTRCLSPSGNPFSGFSLADACNNNSLLPMGQAFSKIQPVE